VSWCIRRRAYARRRAALLDKTGPDQVILRPGQAISLTRPSSIPHGPGTRFSLPGRGAEGLADEIGALDGDGRRLFFARGQACATAASVKMAEIVELVLSCRLTHRCGRTCAGVWPDDRAGRVKIAVRLLGGGDLGDPFIELSVQGRGRAGHERIGCRFDDLVDVRIIEA